MVNNVNSAEAAEAEALESTEKSAKKPDSDQKKPTKPVTMRFSATLHKQLVLKAAEEGIEPHELAEELIAEGLVLRAWEIVERKSAMRGYSGGNNPPRQNNNNARRNDNQKGGGRRNNSSRHRGGQQQGSGALSLMEDKAAWMEYVRNQERGRRK